MREETRTIVTAAPAVRVSRLSATSICAVVVSRFVWALDVCWSADDVPQARSQQSPFLAHQQVAPSELPVPIVVACLLLPFPLPLEHISAQCVIATIGNHGLLYFTRNWKFSTASN